MGKSHFVVTDAAGEPELHRMKAWLRIHRDQAPAAADPDNLTSRQLARLLHKSGWTVREGEHEVHLYPPGVQAVEPGREHRLPLGVPIPEPTPLSGERAWVRDLVPRLRSALQVTDPRLEVRDAYRLAYSREILSYHGSQPHDESGMLYETDLLVLECVGDAWTPRVVVEAKLRSVTTHDAITYSQKAATHKHVHPYLRYGIVLGERGHHPLPGRLFRHGAHFDFMLSWREMEPSIAELESFTGLLLEEVKASQLLQEIMYNTRARNRQGYRLLHKPLRAFE